jgi:hypothetical protein
MPSSRSLIIAADRWVERQHRLSMRTLTTMCNSSDKLTRIKALRFMFQRSSASTPKAYLTIAERLIPDRSNECRWQALIVVSNFVESDPEDVWRIILKFGNSNDEDMRIAVGVVLLEDLLHSHFQEYFPRVKKLLQDGDHRFADTLSHCWKFGDAQMHWPKVESLLRKVKRKN